jgi:hypothetical protein
MLYNIKLAIIALRLEEEEFRRERISSVRRMWAHKCLRNRKMDGEFWTLFNE